MKKNIIIVILVLMVLGLGGYITYDKVLKEKYFDKKEDVIEENKEESKIETVTSFNFTNDEEKEQYEEYNISMNGDNKKVIIDKKLIDSDIYDYDEYVSTFTYENNIFIYRLYDSINGNTNIRTLDFLVFKASDNNDYLIMSERIGYGVITNTIYNSQGKKIYEKDNSIDFEDKLYGECNCLVLRDSEDESDIIPYVENNKLYIYDYYNENGNSYEEKSKNVKYGAFNIDIVNDKITKATSPKETKEALIGQCE